MLKVLQQNQGRKGHSPKLSLTNQLWMSFSYWRKYHTLFHIALSDGVNKSSASRIIRSVEDQLIQSGIFSLPKKPHQGQGLD
jgi:hypothetical protein